MTHPTPLGVFDVRDRPAFDRLLADTGRHDDLLAWMCGQGLPPEDVYRLEIHLIDSPSARVFEYAVDDHGRRYCGMDHNHRAGLCEIARREPYEVLVTSLPPTLEMAPGEEGAAPRRDESGPPVCQPEGRPTPRTTTAPSPDGRTQRTTRGARPCP